MITWIRLHAEVIAIRNIKNNVIKPLIPGICNWMQFPIVIIVITNALCRLGMIHLVCGLYGTAVAVDGAGGCRSVIVYLNRLNHL